MNATSRHMPSHDSLVGQALRLPSGPKEASDALALQSDAGSRVGRLLRLKAWLLVAFIATGLGFASSASAATATATLDAAEIPLGSSVLLTLSVQGVSSLSNPQIPAVDGLQFGSTRQSSNFQFINGAMSSSVSYSIELIPLRAGEFTIPEIAVQAGKETLRTAPLHLKVTGAAPLPATPAPARAGASPAPEAAKADAQSAGAAMFQVVLPRHEAFVGEVLPVQARLFLHPNLKVRQVSVPVIEGDAFTVATVPQQAAQTTENVNGVGYNVLTWSTTVTAVKAGEFPLGGQVQVVVLQTTRNRARDMFGGGFFDEFFGGVEAKTATLATKPVSLRILPLPGEGRPDSFSGAVGRFELSGEADPRQVTAGDPVTLRFTLRGTGNLDRLQPPRLADSSSWKTYPPSARPPLAGQPADATQKHFEQVLIPLDATVTAVPSIPWSYFDPEAKRYVTLTPPALPLKVLPAPAVAVAAAGSNTSAPALTLPPSEEEKALAGATSWTRRAAGRLVIWAQKPVFWLALLFPPVALLLGRGAFHAIQRRRQDPLHLRRLAASRAVRQALLEMDAAQKSGNSPSFFAAASRALREQLAARFRLNAASLVLADVEPFLGHDENLLRDIRVLFEAADAAAFAGAATDAAAMAGWRARLESCLERVVSR